MIATKALVRAGAAVAADHHALALELCRRDLSAFCEFVGRDEKTGEPIRLNDDQRRWCELVGREPRVIIRAFPGAGKSYLLSVLRTCWRLGNDPTLRIGIISNTHHQASRVLRGITALIEADGGPLHEVFPALRLGSVASQTAIIVQRPSSARDYSVVVCGAQGPLTGARLDEIVFDDPDDKQSSGSTVQRANLLDWTLTTVLTRNATNGRVVAVGNCWHPHDLLASLSDRPGWVSVKFPIVDEQGRPSWPERFPASKIEEIRGELGSNTFSQMYLCAPLSDTEARIKREWIDGCLLPGQPVVPALAPEDVPPGASLYLGCDLAVSLDADADLTAISVVMRYPNGHLLLLAVESGHWPAPMILERIAAAWQRYGSTGTVVVESNAAQAYVLALLREKYPGMHVVPHCTTADKKLWGLERLGVELEQGRWSLPADAAGKATDPEVAALCDEAEEYRPALHVGDRLMSVLLAASAARIAGGGDAGTVTVQTFCGRQPGRAPDVDPGLDLERIFADDDRDDTTDDVAPIGSVVQVMGAM